MTGPTFAWQRLTERLAFVLAAFAMLASDAPAQQLRGRPVVYVQPPTPPELAEPVPPPDLPFPGDYLDRYSTTVEEERPGRFAEPPPPPYNPWPPTWLPCQSLRSNRSHVLGHLYFGMDIMGWATKGVQAPALITSSPLGTASTEAGVLGEAGTTVLFGGDYQQDEMRPGGKLTIGWWFDIEQTHGIEWHYFELDGHNHRFNQTVEEGDGILARPYIDATTGDESSLLVSFPGQSGGQIRAWSDLQLTSTGILYRDQFWGGQFARVDYLIGYRHTHLYDRLRILQSIDDGSTVSTRNDSFRSFNSFDGLDLGLRSWWSRNGKLALTGLAKVALGASNTNVVVQGSSENDTAPNQGFLALQSNLGGHPHQDFGIVSEVGLGLEWNPVCQLRLSLGYTWFYWTEVARALDHVDRTLDLDQLTTGTPSNRPDFDLNLTSFWAQGMNAGFTYEF